MTVTNYPFKVENKSRHKPTFSQKKIPQMKIKIYKNK